MGGARAWARRGVAIRQGRRPRSNRLGRTSWAGRDAGREGRGPPSNEAQEKSEGRSERGSQTGLARTLRPEVLAARPVGTRPPRQAPGFAGKAPCSSSARPPLPSPSGNSPPPQFSVSFFGAAVLS